MRDDVANSRKKSPRSWPECVDSAYARTAPSLAAAAPDATMRRHQAASKICSLQMLVCPHSQTSAASVAAPRQNLKRRPVHSTSAPPPDARSHEDRGFIDAITYQ